MSAAAMKRFFRWLLAVWRSLFSLDATAVQLLFLDSERKEISMFKLSVVQKSVLSIQAVDVKGNPATVDGVPEWDVSADGIVTLVPGADGMSCQIFGEGVGNVQVNVTADADLGEGTKTITASLDVTVGPAEAVGFTIQTGAVEDQPVA